MTVAQLKTGQTGNVIQIAGGHGLVRRLHALGIRPGKQVTKMSSMFRRGPVTLQVDNTQIALGFGISSKILVEVDKE
ncbi:MAG: FeoA family protein [Chloroflexota bacterium]|nr:FeoA family protein [Chloroflexota bacterium]